MLDPIIPHHPSAEYGVTNVPISGHFADVWGRKRVLVLG